MNACYAVYKWQKCDLFLAYAMDKLSMLEFLNNRTPDDLREKVKNWYGVVPEENEAVFKDVFAELDRYFNGEQLNFTIPLDLSHGTEFQQLVWQTLLKIPYGVTITYKELATKVGKPNATRAVGSANGKNPIAIIVPCHRVLGSSGKLGGYGGGLEIKDYLLRLEGAII